MSGPTDPRPLETEIEKEADAARADLARNLARKTLESPTNLSGAAINRLGTRGLPLFVDELRQALVREAADANNNPSHKSKLDNSPNKQQKPQHTAVVESINAKPRAPRDVEGWTNRSQYTSQSSRAGRFAGLLWGVAVITAGVIFVIGQLAIAHF